MMDKAIVPDILAPQTLIDVPASATVASAAQLMKDKRIGAVIVTEGGYMVGIFTERDALNRVLAEGRDPEQTHLAEVMTRDPDTLPPDARAGDALALMRERRYRHLPIVEHGAPIAMLSIRDLHEAFMSHMEDEVSFL